MPAPFRTIAAVGVAFAAGIAVKSAVFTGVAPGGASTPAAASQASADGPKGSWSDPVRPAQSHALASGPKEGAAKPVFTANTPTGSQEEAAVKGREIAGAPVPPPRPESVAASDDGEPREKAVDLPGARKARTSPARAHAQLPSVEAMRRAEGDRQGFPHDGRASRAMRYGDGYRVAGYGAYAYAGDPFDDDAYPPPGARRAQPPARRAYRRHGPDGLMGWLTEPGRGY